jgi:hypothetical protein
MLKRPSETPIKNYHHKPQIGETAIRPANACIPDPKIYIPPGSGNLKAKGGAYRQQTHHRQVTGSSKGVGHARTFA